MKVNKSQAFGLIRNAKILARNRGVPATGTPLSNAIAKWLANQYFLVSSLGH